MNANYNDELSTFLQMFVQYEEKYHALNNKYSPL